jgi:hypothetical protein
MVRSGLRSPRRLNTSRTGGYVASPDQVTGALQRVRHIGRVRRRRVEADPELAFILHPVEQGEISGLCPQGDRPRLLGVVVIRAATDS